MTRWTHTFRVVSVLVLATSSLGTAVAQDTSGALSPTRIKLPKGPGSLEGVGENAEAQLNQGQVSYGVPFALPAGQQGMSPSLGLRYSSSGGAGIVGLGWNLGGVPSIERMTSRGLPSYGPGDLFALDGGNELTRVTGGTAAQRPYRERFEGSFARYTWVDPGAAGVAGYWKVETADGRVNYYGARADGTIVPAAQLLGRGGAVFAYYLVESVDPYGHRVVYDYVLDGGRPYLSQVSWGFDGFTAGATPRYTALLEYEPRTDILTDAKSGVLVQLTQRLSAVRVRVNAQLLRRYALTYDTYSLSGGLSRLANVRTFGTDDTTSNPIVFSFSYTRGLDPTCMASGGPNCVRPYRRTVGSVSASFAAGEADFVDMNGDSLPDVLDTTGGVHRVHLQQLDASSMPSFASPLTSGVAGTGISLSNTEVQMLDLDGDGRSDLVDGQTDHVLHAGGATGDWSSLASFDAHLPSMAGDLDLRFLDVDYDRQPDLIHLSRVGAWYYRNTGGAFATSPTPLGVISAGFTEDGLRLSDMNGDGMPDAVIFTTGSISYYPNLGQGAFGAALAMTNEPATWDPTSTDLVDVNGDGMTDLVQVIGANIQYALNGDSVAYSTPVLVTGNDVDGGLPTRFVGTTTVRYVDMNANGTTDIVYVSTAGLVEYVELFEQRPNLLSRVSNGIGKLIDVTYDTVADHMARDGGFGAASGWAHTLPNPMVVVASITVTDTRTNTPQTQQMAYHSAYWDPQEHQFRGFEQVLVTTPGDAHVETGETTHTFDVGVTDRYHRGLPLRVETRSNSRVLSVANTEWQDCAVAQASTLGVAQPVRWICSPRSYTDIVEGLSAAETVRTEERSEYDGYGNKIGSHRLGVISRGGQACGVCTRSPEIQGEPCGPTCEGDEMHELVDFIVPGASTSGRWLLHAPYRKRAYGVDLAILATEERTYYDGPDFVGSGLGTLTVGAVHRVEQRREMGGDSWRASGRFATDLHGNLVTVLDPNARRRGFAYDEAGILQVREQAEFDAPGHAPYSLRMDVSFHPVLEQIVSATDWIRVESGSVVSAARTTTYSYDPLARIIAIAKPGDTLASPSQEFEYDFADPISRIVTRARSVPGSAGANLESVQCFDGLGRKYQVRTRIEAGRYHADGQQLYDSHGQVYRQYQPHLVPSGECDSAVPSAPIRYTTIRHDASNRSLEVEFLDGDENDGVNSTERTVYSPLGIDVWDAEDTSLTSPHRDTPSSVSVDGLGRHLSQLRRVSLDEAPISTSLTYDALGRIRSLRDDSGNEQLQRYDLLGRVVEVDHPDSGNSEYEYDDAGNLISKTDSRLVRVRNEYDESNRVLATWDADDEDATLVRFSYDGSCAGGPTACPNGEGQLVEVTYPVLDEQWARETVSRDGRGREVTRIVQRGTRSYQFATAYDGADRAIARTFPDGSTLDYELDGAGRVVRVPGFVDSIAYDSRGQMARIGLRNGVGSVSEFDGRQRIKSISTTEADGTKVQDLSFAWDRVGNVVAIHDSIREMGSSPTATGIFEYDALYRLTSAALDPGRSSEETLEYQYDRIENVTHIQSSRSTLSPAHVGTLRYGENGAGPHAVSTAGSDVVQYDSAGNVISRQGIHHEWDHQGRLVRTSDSASRELSRNSYREGMARSESAHRGHAVEYLSDDFEVRDGIAVMFVRIGSRTIARSESGAFSSHEMPDLAPCTSSGVGAVPIPNGAINAADAFLLHAKSDALFVVDTSGTPVPSGPQADVDVMLAASAQRLLLGTDAQGVTFEHVDHLGTVGAETDESGRTTQRAHAYPFGTPRYVEGSGWSRHGFSGMERDSGSGLQFHGSRWLDPRSTRWTRPDPAFAQLTVPGDNTRDRAAPEDERRASPTESSNFAEAAAAYSYARNRPLSAIDLIGLLTELIIWEAFECGGTALVGHVAIRINGTVFNFVGHGLETNVWTAEEATRRRNGQPGAAFALAVTPDQEALLQRRMESYIAHQDSTDPNHTGMTPQQWEDWAYLRSRGVVGGGYDLLQRNCGDMVMEMLNANGLFLGLDEHAATRPAGYRAAIREYMATTIKILRGSGDPISERHVGARD